MYHKLIHGFYNSPKNPVEALLKPEYRTVDNIADVALELIEDLKCKRQPSLQTIKNLITDTKYANEYLTKPNLKIRKTLKKRRS
jgi:hypothetical protein